MSARRRSKFVGVLQLLAQPANRWPLAIEAAAELALMKARVSLFPFRAYSSLTRGDESWPDGITTERIKALVWAVESTGSYAPVGINCLPRALALQRMLIRRGCRGTIRFGVRKRIDGLDAHAWLVMGNKVLIGGLPDLHEYAVLASWPS